MLAAQAEAAMWAHSRACSPAEACGLLLGVEAPVSTVCEVFATPNRSSRAHAFLIAPEDLGLALGHAAARGQTVLGVFHSHPHGPATPSHHDQREAVPGWLYAITTFKKDCSPSLQIWRCHEHGAGFALAWTPPRSKETTA
jgi:proteasome lid subunit RPN8/RPN11